MQTLTIRTYSFDELPEEAKEKAVQTLSDINVDYEWYDYIFEEWTGILEAKGYKDIEINFSGFWSQGDGASFTAKVDIAKWLKAHKLANKYRKLFNIAEEVQFSIIRLTHHYYHSHTIDTYEEGLYYLPEETGNQGDAVLELLQQEARELSDAIYSELEKGYDYLRSQEQIEETIRANDFQFTAKGSRSIYL
jgi:hypothetical protein